MRSTIMVLVALYLVGCVTTQSRNLSGSPIKYIQVNDNLKYTITKRPNSAGISAIYEEFTFFPANLANLAIDCEEIGYELAEQIKKENNGLIEIIEGSLSVTATRDRFNGTNSCFIKFRVDITEP